jgi:anti-anti-sigma factor
MAELRLLSSGHDLVVRTRDESGVRIVSVAGEADLQTEHRLSRALRDALPEAGSAVVLDLSGLTFCSAYAMGVLVDMVGSAVHEGVKLVLVGLPPITARVWLFTEVPVPVQYASVKLAVAALATPARRWTDRQADVSPGTARLLAELDVLRRALSTRATIEQAKGMLMERLSCSSEQAFDMIVLQSQQTARRLQDVAVDFVSDGESGSVAAASQVSDLASPVPSSPPRDPEPAA